MYLGPQFSPQPPPQPPQPQPQPPTTIPPRTIASPPQQSLAHPAAAGAYEWISPPPVATMRVGEPIPPLPMIAGLVPVVSQMMYPSRAHVPLEVTVRQQPQHQGMGHGGGSASQPAVEYRYPKAIADGSSGDSHALSSPPLPPPPPPPLVVVRSQPGAASSADPNGEPTRTRTSKVPATVNGRPIILMDTFSSKAKPTAGLVPPVLDYPSTVIPQHAPIRPVRRKRPRAESDASSSDIHHDQSTTAGSSHHARHQDAGSDDDDHSDDNAAITATAVGGIPADINMGRTRAERKRISNTLSARRARARRIALTEYLERRVMELENEKAALETRLDALEAAVEAPCGACGTVRDYDIQHPHPHAQSPSSAE
ncbi:hypothetical protein BC828DRAFT_373409 [Blastocladiella britannica]|nr:hypothetical protein BC828DRAFT_373409 [Blastocladiella britannica]